MGVLRDIFLFIHQGNGVPEQIEWILDSIAETLAETDVNKILRNKKRTDSIVHFYETFLSKYDPKSKKKRGVYYTPESVVSYIVKSLHHILQKNFNKSKGFADETVTVLDPAAGTLTFLAEAVKIAVREYVEIHGSGEKNDFIKRHILKNFYAFEVMMVPYVIGHLKMSFLFEQLGCNLNFNNRFNFHITNTLEMEIADQPDIPNILPSLSEESRLAGMIKKEQPVLVILGNPPYSTHSANKGKWIDDLLKKNKGNYYDKILGEKNSKVISDDYVKFIRFAQWKIDNKGEGVLGFITNHSYLSNRTFRGMRESLMHSFDEIYILNLHGNSTKKRNAPRGSKNKNGKDENIFDIRQGVAISIFIKNKNSKPEAETKIYYAYLWGLREKKYNWLKNNDFTPSNYEIIEPKSPYYFFVPIDEESSEKYEKGKSLEDIFIIKTSGIDTARDDFTIDWTYKETLEKVTNFSKMDPERARVYYDLPQDTKSWQVKCAQDDLINLDEENIIPIDYRLFDKRHTYYTKNSNGYLSRPRYDVMKYMLKDNIGLLTCKGCLSFKHAFVSKLCVVSSYISNRGGERGYMFPLYQYQEIGEETLKLSEEINKISNINQEFHKFLEDTYRKSLTPEEIFYYIYSVLYSNDYRTDYEEFLEIEFPKILFPQKYEIFRKMSELGKKLAELHLMKSVELSTPIAKFQGRGSGKVQKIKYKDEKVFINENQYFEGVEREVYNYVIGGYQVCHQWLKSRKGKGIKIDGIHYCKVVTAIKKTIEIQEEIDKVYKEVESQIIDMNKYRDTL